MEAPDEIGHKSHAQPIDQRKRPAEYEAPAVQQDSLKEPQWDIAELFRGIFQDSPFGVGIVNRDLRLVAANPSLCRMLGSTEDEITNLTLSSITHLDDLEKDVEHTKRLFAGEIPSYRMELRHIRKDGGPSWVRLTGSLIRAAPGNTAYCLRMIEDIAERNWEVPLRESARPIPECDAEQAPALRRRTKLPGKRFAQLEQTEKALLESNERLRSIVETANDPIIGADSLGNIITWNSAATRTFGYSAEEVMNQPVTMLMSEPFALLHEHAMKRAVASGDLYYAKRVREAAGRKKDGTEFPIEVSLSAWKTQQGVFFTGIVRDITERKRQGEELRKVNEELELRVRKRTAELVALNESLKHEIEDRERIEAMLRDSERQYHTLVEEVPDVIFTLCKEGRLTFLNAQAEEFLKQPLQEILETPLASYVAPEEREKIESIFRLDPDSIWDGEIRLLDADGEEKFARIRCKALGTDGKSKIQYEGVMRDITRRRRLEEQLKVSREELLEKIRIIDELYAHIVESGKARAIAEHTAEVAHELRQPLTIIGGFARRMARQLDSCDIRHDTGQAQAVRVIGSEIQRLEKTLNTLIDFTRRESVTQEMANPNAVIEKVVSLYKEMADQKSIKLEVILRDEVGEIGLDRERFEQVVRNLISNSMEASPIGQTIRIETRLSIPSSKVLEVAALESATYFEMKIRNHGPVIDQDELHKLFSPFFTTKSSGTGMGLALSKRIIEAHNGSISVHSEESGTTFTVWLPLNHPTSSIEQLA
jgi:PAS domain S-box-containing protein